MSDNEKLKSASHGDDGSRREALIKIGKYAAYTPPAMVVTLSAARGATVSGATTPAPTPSPTPAPTNGPP